MELKQSVILITGGASGLGLATAEHLSGLGARVAVVDMNEEAGAEAVKSLSNDAAFFRADVTDEASAEAAVNATVERFGALHACINCAGIGTPAKTLGRDGPLPLASFSKIISVNLIGTFNVLRLAAEQMAKNEPLNDDGERGVIINTASVAAFDGQIGQAAYSASKGGIVGMTLPIARDLAPYNIRINTIAPGIMGTPLLESALSDKVKAHLLEMVQFPHRLGKPAEFARLAVHLIENSYINAEVIRIDGGIRMQPR